MGIDNIEHALWIDPRHETALKNLGLARKRKGEWEAVSREIAEGRRPRRDDPPYRVKEEDSGGVWLYLRMVGLRHPHS